MPWPTGDMPVLELVPGEVRASRAPIPAEAPGEVLVEVSALGVCGTDLDLFLGTSFFIDSGLTTYPLRFGHEWVGTVAAVGDGVEHIAVGDRVTGQTIVPCDACDTCRSGRPANCPNRAEVGLHHHDGAAASYISMPQRSIVRLPDAGDLADYALVEPGVTAMHALARTAVGARDRVLVLGSGTLGLLAVAAARRRSQQVDAVSGSERGRALQQRVGATRTLTPEQVDADAYDVVLEMTGREPALAQTVRALRPGGRAALVGVVTEPAASLVPAAIVMKNLTLHGILHGLDHYAELAALIADDGVPVGAIVDRVLPWSDAQHAFELMRDRAIERPKLLLDLTTMR